MAAFLTHQQKVLRLYKRALRHLESWCIFRPTLSCGTSYHWLPKVAAEAEVVAVGGRSGQWECKMETPSPEWLHRDEVEGIKTGLYRDRYRFFACLLRARFEEHKDEKDMVKATKLLMAAEEEFWEKQHPQPYIFPDAPGGTSYERYDCYKVPEWALDFWHPSEKAMYPDYFAKREQWKKLRLESWEKEVQQLQEETPPGGPRTESLPPARKAGHLPPLWWHHVTRPRERPM